MKLYIWDNEADRDDPYSFNTGELASLVGTYLSGYHSGCWVVLADSVEDAIGLIRADTDKWQTREDAKWTPEADEYLRTKLSEERSLEAGVVYYGDGDC